MEKKVDNVSINCPLAIEDEIIIRRSVNSNYFNIDAFVKYLNNNYFVDFKIFSSSVKKEISRNIDWTYVSALKETDRVKFLRRLPIYFYDINNDDDFNLSMTDFFNGYYSYKTNKSIEYYFEDGLRKIKYSDDFDFEELYKLIEEVIYKYNIPFKKVLEYIYEQIGAVSDYDIFNKWIKYIRLLDVVNENLVFPKNLFYSYNVVREKNGLQPIMYYPSEWKMKNAVAAERHGDIFKVGGYFPVDENNMPALKWIGVWFEDVTILPVNGQVVEYDKSLIRLVEDNYKPALKVSLKFKLTPNSRIFVYRKETLHIDSFTDEEDINDYWLEVYAGPKYMRLDLRSISKIREEKGLSTKDVSEATNINLRTYQRIEQGETTPDALNLLKVINLLNISDINSLVKKEIIVDPNLEKFSSGKKPSEFIKVIQNEMDSEDIEEEVL